MDIFKFNNPTNLTRMEEGEILNGLTTVLWVERWQAPGEFEIKAPASSGIHEKLPLGSFISRPNATQVMVVENHEITEEKNKEPEVRVTGRSLETILDLRSVGKTAVDSTALLTVGESGERISIAAGTTAARIELYINSHMSSWTFEFDDHFDDIEAIEDIVGSPTESESKPISWGPLYTNLLPIIKAYDYNLKSVRPGPWSPFGASSTKTALYLHEGADRSSQLFLSYELGDIERAEYLFSNKNFRNVAHVIGKWFRYTYIPTPQPSKYNRRYLTISASDVDGQYSTRPASGSAERTRILNDFAELAKRQLAASKGTALVKAEVSETFDRFQYRVDYDIGDLITVLGSYETEAVMRVTEHVEAMDESGFKSYPVLSLV